MTEKTKAVGIFLVLLTMLLCTGSIQAADPELPRIFDLSTRDEIDVEGVTPSPLIGYDPSTSVWHSLYDHQDSVDGIICLRLINKTGPYDGDSYDGGDSDVLGDAIDYIDNSGYVLDYIFADFESDTEDENVLEMVDQVKNHADPSVNLAYVGSYDYYPGATDYSHRFGTYDRTDRHTFYINSGLDIAQPSLYPYSYYISHTTSVTPLCVSIRHALFWAPLEKFDTAKNALPDGHIIIPWVGDYIFSSNYEADPPSKADCRAFIQHLRLRGTDGYYSYWGHEDDSLYEDAADYRDDIYHNGWKPLNWFFSYPNGLTYERIGGKVLNLTTNKTGGVEWSGMRRGNRCLFIFSNFTGSSAQVSLPGDIENLPEYSPAIPAGEHLVVDYVVGPLGNIKFDENTGTTISDSQENLTDGTISGATWVTGVSGSALDFNGSSDYVALGTQNKLNMTGSRTISAWINPDATDGYRIIAAKYMWNSGLWIQSGHLRGYVGASGGAAESISNETLSTGNWYHVAMTFDIEGDKKVHLYINGVEATYSTQVVMNDSVSSTATGDFTIGRDRSARYWFDGTIDEVKVYTGCLSAKEIYDDYASVFEPLGNIKFDENKGTTISDAQENLTDGTLSGATWVTGVSGSALDFNGSSDYVAFGNQNKLNMTGNRTISAWINPDATNGYRIIAAKYMWNSGLWVQNGYLHGYIGASGGAAESASTETLSTGNWYHVAMTFDISGDKKIHLYINGVEATYSTQIAMNDSVSSTATGDFTIGRDRSARYWFDGTIDEVKVYERTLSAQEIYDDYASVLNVRFDKSTDIANDDSIFKHTGTVSGATHIEGMFGYALDFNGSSDYVAFGNHSKLNLTGSRTISAWINPDATDGYRIIAAKYMWNSGLWVQNGYLHGYIGASGGAAESVSTETLSTGNWYHVAMTFDINGDKKIHLYINGVETTYSTQTAMNDSISSTATGDFTIGRDRSARYWFDGLIDEVKMYDKALDSNAVGALYNSY